MARVPDRRQEVNVTGKAVLSAIVVSPGGCDAVAPVLRCLQSQTIRDRIEIVLVTAASTELPGAM